MASTQSIALTNNWQQITTGVENALIQTISGKFALCVSDSHPVEPQAFHVLSELNITPPTKAWVKTFTPGTKLVITYM
ncbi:MAG: hypothetical protein E6997_17640 [Citrobacter sp.]|jgi:hypothetical protein|uniref:hypothetical protein n=1 Tax=Citrobacter braakii TaxID=57706 RepID=UPI0023AEA4AB|nr:hypothetical protein [Citrobacter braakii]MDU1184813.1 hypothetical protein [Citrobacter sp.]